MRTHTSAGFGRPFFNVATALAVAAAAFLVVNEATPAAAAPAVTLTNTWTITDLGPGSAMSITNNGKIVGLSKDDHVMRYSKTEAPVDLGAVANASNALVDETGQVTVEGFGSPSNTIYRFTNNAFVPFVLPQGWSNPQLGGVNEVGTVVGSATNQSASRAVRLFPTFADLGPGRGEGVSPTGVVVGATIKNEKLKAAKFEGGSAVTLDANTNSTNAHDVNDFGLAVGTVRPPPSSSDNRAATFNGGQVTDLGQASSQLKAVNSSGVATGNSSCDCAPNTPYVFIDGALVKPNDFLPAASGWEINVLHDINDSNEVVGDAILCNGDDCDLRAILLKVSPGTTPTTSTSSSSTLPTTSSTVAPTSTTTPAAPTTVKSQITTGPGAGGGPHVRLFSAGGGAVTNGFFAEGASSGGLPVARGDLDNDGVDDIVTGAERGGSTVRVFSSTGKSMLTLSPYGSFGGGVEVAVADVVGSTAPEIITAAGRGGGPHVKVFSATGQLVGEFFAYLPSFNGGVHVGAGQAIAGGKSEIVTGAGPGGGPHVRVFDAAGNDLSNGGFFAYAPSMGNGVYVAAGILQNASRIVTGAGAGGGPHVRVFDANGTDTANGGFFAYTAAFPGGVRVAVANIDSGDDELVTGAGPGGGPHVRAFRGDLSPMNVDLFPYPGFAGGVYVASGRN